MAFTSTQKDAVRGYLNYPTEAWAITYISDRMDSVSSLSSDAETRVVDILSNIESIDTQRMTYLSTAAGIELADRTTGYYRGQALYELDNQYSYWQNKLSIALNISVLKQNSSNRILRS